MAGNVFLNGAKPSKHEKSPLLAPDFDPALKLHEEGGSWFLDCRPAPGDAKPTGPLVNSELLGKAAVSSQPYVKPDGSPHRLDRDYFGTRHPDAASRPGPFATPVDGKQGLKVWPLPPA